MPILNWSCYFFAPSVSAEGCSRVWFILMAGDFVVICNLHFFSDSLYPFVLLPVLAINLRRVFKKNLCLSFLFIPNLKKWKIQNYFLKQVMLIGIEISLSKLMLAEVTVVRNPTTLKKEMPKGFVQSNIIIVTLFTLFF